MTALSPPELLVCDTGFVGLAGKRAARPKQFAHWPASTLARIDSAILAISVITLAEARFGYANARWGEAKIVREEQRLASFLKLPLDLAVIDEWARLEGGQPAERLESRGQRSLDCGDSQRPWSCAGDM